MRRISTVLFLLLSFVPLLPSQKRTDTAVPLSEAEFLVFALEDALLRQFQAQGRPDTGFARLCTPVGKLGDPDLARIYALGTSCVEKQQQLVASLRETRRTLEGLLTEHRNQDVGTSLAKLALNVAKVRTKNAGWHLALLGMGVLLDVQRKSANAAVASKVVEKHLKTAAQQARDQLEGPLEAIRSAVWSVAEGWGWQRGEVGFDFQPAWVARETRPRDPFVLARWARMRIGEAQAGVLMQQAVACARAYRLTPKGDFYDRFRTRFVTIGVERTAQGMRREWHEAGYRLPSPSAGRVRPLLEAALQHDPVDRNRHLLALCCLLSEDPAKAIEMAGGCKSLWGDSTFALDLAMMLTQTNEHQRAFEWAVYAIELDGAKRAELLRSSVFAPTLQEFGEGTIGRLDKHIQSRRRHNAARVPPDDALPDSRLRAIQEQLAHVHRCIPGRVQRARTLIETIRRSLNKRELGRDAHAAIQDVLVVQQARIHEVEFKKKSRTVDRVQATRRAVHKFTSVAKKGSTGRLPFGVSASAWCNFRIAVNSARLIDYYARKRDLTSARKYDKKRMAALRALLGPHRGARDELGESLHKRAKRQSNALLRR